jgi:CBS domain-containing protein
MKAIYTATGGLPGDGIDASRKRVTAAMSWPVRCVSTSTTLGEALQTMVQSALRHRAVVDNAGRFIGIVADRAIVAAWAADPSGLSRIAVAEAVEPGPATVRSGARVLDAARAMRAVGTDAVAVVDDGGCIVGIVTGSDMIAQLAR